MSDFLAEASVLIRPDTSKFRAELQAKLAAATRGIVVPVTIGGPGTVAQARVIEQALTGINTAAISTTKKTQAAATESAKGVAAAQVAGAKAIKGTTAAMREQAREAAAHARNLEQLSRGAAATALSMGGLRGATLAASAAFLAGAAAITVFAKATFAAVSFQQQLAVFGATTSATADQLRQVEEAAKQLGADLSLPGISASDAAVAMTELAKAGLSVEDSIRGARGVLQLAIAANISFAEATELSASALNAFQLEGSKASHVADVLANAANSAQGSIVDIGVALQQSAAVGKQVGLTFEDTTVFLTALARAGLRSSDAGTSLRVALVRLINPSKKAQEAFEQMGLAVRDARGNMRPEFFVNLGAALAGMGKKQRDATLALIGGQDAMRALSILSRLSINDFINLRDELAKQGTASDLANARMTGLAGAGQNLSNVIANIGISIGQRANPALASFVNSLTSAIQAASKSPIFDTIGQAAGVAADAFRSLGAAIQTVAPILGAVATGLAAVSNAVGVGTILAGVAAFALYQRTLLPLIWITQSVATGIRSIAAAAAVSGGLMASLRTTTAAVGASFAAFATSVTGVTLGLAALTAGLVFLFTRESELDRAQRRLKDSTDALVGSFSSAESAAKDYADAVSSVKTERLALQTAKLAAEQAKQDLASSDAARGSLQREQLENRLAVALDNVRLSEQALRGELEREQTAAEANQVAQENRKKAIDVEEQAIRKLIGTLEKRRRIIEITEHKQPFQEADLANLNRDLVQTLRDRAAAERAANEPAARDTAKRLDALAEIARRMQGIQSPVISLIFDAKDVNQGLKQVEAFFRQTGQKSAAEFTNAWRLSLDPSELLKPVNDLIDMLNKFFANAGKDAGDAYGTKFVGSLRQWLGVAAGFARAAMFAEVAGDRAGRLAALGREEAALRNALAKAKTPETQQKVLQQLLGVINEEKSIRSEIASEREKAARANEEKARKAQEARDRADRAFLDMLGLRQGRVSLKAAQAEGTKSLVDDISAQRELQRLLQTAITQARATIQNALLRAQTVLELQTQLANVNNAIRNLVAQQKQARAERRREREQNVIDQIDLDIEFAQIKKNVSAEIRAHEAKIKALKDRQARTKRGTEEWKRLRNEIAAEQAAIAELRKQQKDRAKEFQALSFEFLQAQQGFAASLLSNLLPTGALAGAVGGTSIAISTPTGGAGAGGPQRPPDVGADLGRQAAVSTAPRGVSAGQMGQLIAIQKQMLTVMLRLAGGRTHPEATNQRVDQTSLMSHGI